jgi:FkbM family methyltransferase
MTSLNHSEVKRWKNDNGDNTYNVNYELNSNSNIIDLGGFTGVWADQMINKYDSNLFILEPVPQFYDILVEKFKDNSKVNLLNVGVSTENEKGIIFLNNDASSSNSTVGEPVDVEYLTMDSVLEKWNLYEVDLLQINIEGAEYNLLDYMIQNNILKKFKNIQIQFHTVIENYEERRNLIQQGFIGNGFELTFNYPFVWEGWTRL